VIDRSALTRTAVIEALVGNRGVISAAARSIGFSGGSNLRHSMRNMGLSRRRVGGVLIIEDRRARVEGCCA
jgi:hypothetical protein